MLNPVLNPLGRTKSDRLEETPVEEPAGSFLLCTFCLAQIPGLSALSVALSVLLPTWNWVWSVAYRYRLPSQADRANRVTRCAVRRGQRARMRRGTLLPFWADFCWASMGLVSFQKSTRIRPNAWLFIGIERSAWMTIPVAISAWSCFMRSHGHANTERKQSREKVCEDLHKNSPNQKGSKRNHDGPTNRSHFLWVLGSVLPLAQCITMLQARQFSKSPCFASVTHLAVHAEQAGPSSSRPVEADRGSQLKSRP